VLCIKGSFGSGALFSCGSFFTKITLTLSQSVKKSGGNQTMALFIWLIIRAFQLIFFSRNSIFLSQQISQQYFSAGLSAQPNGPI
jgi:hypothetical protein